MKLTKILAIVICFFTHANQLKAEDLAPEKLLNQDGQLVDFVPDTGAADRINAADRLRTLSQEISAETCFLHNAVLPDYNRAALGQSIVEFGDLLNALLNGDATRHIIGAEQNPKTILEIEAIKAEWSPIYAAAEQVLADPTNAAAVHRIYGQSEHLLATTSHLLGELEAEYSHPTEVLMSDVLLIEFAGRQAMLTQKIAYDTCLVWSGFGGQAQIDELQKICDDFDEIARALHDGLPAAGIVPAPTDAIRVALEEVIVDWDIVRAQIGKITQDGEADGETISWIDEVLTQKMHRMEAIIALYVEYSRRALI